MKIIKPKPLFKGAVIGIVAPASSPNSIDLLNKGIRYLEQIGYRVELGKHIFEKNGYLAGSDKDRANDINRFIRDPQINAIFVARGGYGSHRILSLIDYEAIQYNPKIFVGYSDITALQLAMFAKTGLVTFSGPMVATDLAKPLSDRAEELFWKLLTSTKPLGNILEYQKNYFDILENGRAEGILLGGNLSIIVSLLGTEYFPSFSNSIIVLEDINEAPYRIDRMLTQLKLAKVLKKVRAALLGDFSTCIEKANKPTLTLEEIFKGVFKKIPMISNLYFGHVKNSITLPLGIKCKVDTIRKSICLLDSSVVN